MAPEAATQPNLRDLAVGAILLVNAGMAFRNAIIVIPFIPEAALIVGIPLDAITLAGIVTVGVVLGPGFLDRPHLTL